MSSRAEIKKSPLSLAGGDEANKGLRQQATRGVGNVPGRREESRVNGKRTKRLKRSSATQWNFIGPLSPFFFLPFLHPPFLRFRSPTACRYFFRGETGLCVSPFPHGYSSLRFLCARLSI